MQPWTRLTIAMIAIATACERKGEEDEEAPAKAFPFDEVALVSDVEGRALVTDPRLVNPWGLAFGPDTPFWIANNGSSTLTVYDAEGNPQPLAVAVEIGAPTGIVFNPTEDLVIGSPTPQLVGGPATFIISTEGGFLLGWNPSSGAQAVIAVDRSGDGASYSGLALATDTSRGTLLYAANSTKGTIDVFDANFQPIELGPGAFVDNESPRIPDSYGPFGIEAIGDRIFVTYAERDPDTGAIVPGRGSGFVNAFTTDGFQLFRVPDEGLHLDAPWGIVLGPSDYGPFAGAILIGNFGDGRINAFNPDTGAWIGYLRRESDGAAIEFDGLRAIELGNGTSAGATNELFFTAGLHDQRLGVDPHGIFGRIRPVSQ